MTMTRDTYAPGAALGADVRKEGDRWTLVFVRELRYPPTRVWQALTEPDQLRHWAPFDTDRSLGATGAVSLSTVGVPTVQTDPTTVTRAEPPKLLEYGWGGNELRWQIEAIPTGTRLTLWHTIDRGFISWGAAGWHICFDVLDLFLSGEPIGRIVGTDALQLVGWQKLNADYAKQFGVEVPAGPTTAA